MKKQIKFITKDQSQPVEKKKETQNQKERREEKEKEKENINTTKEPKKRYKEKLRKMKLYHFDWGKIMRYSLGEKPIISIPTECWEKKQPNQVQVKAKLFGMNEVAWDPTIGSRYIDTKVEIVKEVVYTMDIKTMTKVYSHTITKVKLKPSIGEMTVLFEIDKYKQANLDSWKEAYKVASGNLTRNIIAIETNRDLVIASTIINVTENVLIS